MKLSEFRELCDREWGEARGDVIGLCLTDESAGELHRDVIMDGSMSAVPFPLLIDKSELAAIRAGEFVIPLSNPVTRSLVKVTKGADTDTAEVRRYWAEPHPAGIPCT